MLLHFLGVRGSTPTPGADFVRHGGHTSCLAVSRDDGSVPLVLDAGTGLRSLARMVAGGFRGTLLLTHLHWDHTHGLPFSSALDNVDSDVRVFAPGEDGETVDGLLSRAMSPPNFPITPGQLRGRWRWERADEGPLDVDGFEVLAREIPHKGGRTFGYRVSSGGASFAYLPDHMPQALGDGPDGLGAHHEAAMELADGVDVLIHDSQYTAEELPTRGSFGHAAAEYAVSLGAKAGVGLTVLFHHDPARTDPEIDAIVGRFADAADAVVAAQESMVVDCRTRTLR